MTTPTTGCYGALLRACHQCRRYLRTGFNAQHPRPHTLTPTLFYGRCADYLPRTAEPYEGSD